MHPIGLREIFDRLGGAARLSGSDVHGVLPAMPCIGACVPPIKCRNVNAGINS